MEPRFLAATLSKTPSRSDGQGVKFYFCQNTTRAYLCQPGTAITSLPKYLLTGVAATDQMIDGMEYTTAGLTSIADFQAQGYQYIQP